MQKPQRCGVGVALDDITATALINARDERWSISVVVGGQEIMLVRGRPGRHLVIEVGKDSTLVIASFLK